MSGADHRDLCHQPAAAGDDLCRTVELFVHTHARKLPRGAAEDKFDRYLGNRLVVGIVSTVSTQLLGCMAANGLARFRSPGRCTVAYTSLLLRIVPLAVLANTVFLIWNQKQLVNSLWGLVLHYMAVNLPFTIWLLYGFALQVPIELEEAAAIDDCGPV